MKLPQRKKYWQNPLIIIIFVGVLALAGLTSAAYHYQYWPFAPASDNSNKPSPEEQGKLDKKKAIEDKGKSQTSSTNVDASKSPNTIPVSTTTSVEITNLQQSNGKVIYAATVTNPAGSGTCSAVFTNDIAKPVTRTTGADGTSCGPVSIPESEFSAIGTWTLTLRYYTDGTQAVTTKTIDVK